MQTSLEKYQAVLKDLQDIIADMADTREEHTVFLTDQLKEVRTILVPELESENNIALDGKGTIDDEVLRNYIRISRDIRTFIFDNIDTHVLTIEKLADQILCRRRAYERRTKDTTKNNTAVQQSGISTKAVVEKQPVNKAEDLLKQFSSLSPEDLAKVLAGLVK